MLAAYAAQPEAVAVVGVNVQDRPDAALTLLATLDAHFPSVTDPDGALQRGAARSARAPLSFVVRPDGAVRLIPPRVFGSVDEIRRAAAEYGSS